MIPDLRTALHAEADAVPAYSVYERAVRTARRRRRTRWALSAAAAVVVTLVALSGVTGVMLADPPPTGTAGTRPSVPDRLAFPPAFWPSVTGSPPGTASVLFGGTGFAVDRPLRLLDNEGDLAVVGATSDVYRVMRVGYEGHAGEDALISPDGNRLALSSGFGGYAGILDLTTGTTTRLAAFTGRDYVTPMAWAPDGRTLAVRVVGGGSVQVGLVDVPDGSFRKASWADGSATVPGFEVAFSPDGKLWAYATRGEIVVSRPDLTILGRISLPPQTWLAGKGAWTADGQLMTMSLIDGRWRLQAVDVTSVVPTAPKASGQVWPIGGDELTAVRLLGWSGGQPVVAVYEREPGNKAGPPVTYYQAVRTVAVWRLTSSGHDVMLTAPRDAQSIDISDAAIIGGETRPGSPPRFGVLTIGPVALLAIAVVAGGWLLRRSRRSRR